MNSEMLAQVARNIHLDSLDESTLSRVWKHTTSPETVFAMMSASRGSRTPEDNVKANIALASQLRNLGYGYFWLHGYTIENEGTPDEQRVSEDSLFIIGTAKQEQKMKKDLLELAKKYQQDSIFFKPAQSDKGQIISSDGSVVVRDLDLHPDKMGIYYSQLRNGKPFTFESAGEPSSAIHKWAKKKSVSLRRT